MAVQFDMSKFYVDFSDRDNLTNDEKVALENIQKIYMKKQEKR